jgi:hypothetical protein
VVGFSRYIRVDLAAIFASLGLSRSKWLRRFPPLAAVLAGFRETAERYGAAVLDRRHHLELGEAQMPG